MQTTKEIKRKRKYDKSVSFHCLFGHSIQMQIFIFALRERKQMRIYRFFFCFFCYHFKLSGKRKARVLFSFSFWRQNITMKWNNNKASVSTQFRFGCQGKEKCFHRNVLNVLNLDNWRHSLFIIPIEANESDHISIETKDREKEKKKFQSNEESKR